MDAPTDKDQVIKEALARRGYDIEFHLREGGQPIPVGYQGVLSDEVRQQITAVFQRHMGSDVQLELGVSKRQLAILRHIAFKKALAESRLSLVELACRCEEVVGEERMRDIERTEQQKNALAMIEKLRGEFLFGAAGDKRDEAMRHLDEIARILRYVDGRKLDCTGPWAERSLLLIEEGRKPLNHDTALVLAKALGIQAEQLLIVPDANVVDFSNELDFPLGGHESSMEE